MARATVARQTAGASMVTPARVILLEFNELTPTLIDKFISQGHLGNFKRLRDEAQVFITDAEEAAPNLEPWIQWVTVHSGQSYDQHGIFHLGDGHKLACKQIWDLISDAGLGVWVCGSMNMRYDTPINGAMLPDPWTFGTPAYPAAEFEPYVRFVQRNVQEHTNDKVALSGSDYLDFLRFMVAHGLSASTITAIVRQLAEEKVSGKGRWRRATILDRLQWDVFCSRYRRTRPHFATMFLNSTAHFQHMYWRNMEPEQFKLKPTAKEQAEYESAILYGYREMDRIIGDALALVGDDGTLILSSALGQQPCLVYEDLGGKTFYRPRVFERLLEFVGIEDKPRIEPVMSEQFQLRFDSPEATKAAARQLSALRVGGKAAMLVEERGDSLFCGCKIFTTLDKDTELEAGDNRRSVPFFRLFYQVEGLKSGMHHPDGILWIRRPGLTPRVHDERVPLRAIAPTLLSFYGIEPPPYMTGTPLTLEAQAADHADHKPKSSVAA